MSGQRKVQDDNHQGLERGPKKKNGAKTSSEGLYGAATANSSFEGTKGTS